MGTFSVKRGNNLTKSQNHRFFIFTTTEKRYIKYICLNLNLKKEIYFCLTMLNFALAVELVFCRKFVRK